MRVILAVLLSYLLGGLLFGELIALISRVDLRKRGSGNPGATNVYRILGPLFGLIVLVGDTLKGIIGSLIGSWLGVPEIAPWCGLAVIAGHNWPLQFKFKGGKGIATSFGTIIVLAPETLLIIAPSDHHLAVERLRLPCLHDCGDWPALELFAFLSG